MVKKMIQWTSRTGSTTRNSAQSRFSSWAAFAVVLPRILLTRRSEPSANSTSAASTTCTAQARQGSKPVHCPHNFQRLLRTHQRNIQQRSSYAPLTPLASRRQPARRRRNQLVVFNLAVFNVWSAQLDLVAPHATGSLRLFGHDSGPHMSPFECAVPRDSCSRPARRSRRILCGKNFCLNPAGSTRPDVE